MQLPHSQSNPRLVSVLVGVLLIALSAVAAHAKPSFLVKPPPSWARTIAINSDRQTAATTATGSTSLKLDDNEIRVSKNSVERFYHYAQKIETTAGLDDLSQIKFHFEPSYQQLTIHYVRVLRGGSVIDALKSSEVKTIQDEDELDQQLYNGTFAAVVFMNDLRVGDVVDYAYTITGENPVLGGRFTERIYLVNDHPTEKLAVRLLWPTERTLSLRPHNTDLKPSIRNNGNETEYLWESDNVSAAESEDSTPGWVEPYPTVDLSEFNNWNEVVVWGLPLYKPAGADPPELTAKIAKWKSDLKTPEERLIAALRFTQDEIRYLGIELGRYSHQPNPPAKVFGRRFGDCKDKSFLLSTILTELGIDAAPAMVSTKKGKALDDWQPTPFAFNHVIVQAKLEGKTYWLDPTISFQRGTLASYYDPPYARALVMREGVNALETIPSPAASAGSRTVNEVYTIFDYSTPVRLVVTTLYKGSDADAMRYSLSQESLEELGGDNLNYYANEAPSIQLDGLPKIKDDQETNILKVTERYSIDKLWTSARHSFVADQIYRALERPSVSKRSTPFAITYPLAIDQTIDIELPPGVNLESDSGSISDAALRLTFRKSMVGQAIRLEYSLRSLNDHVAAGDIGKHFETIEQMRESVGIELPRGSGVLIRRAPTVAAISPSKVLEVLLVPFVIGLVVFGFLLRARRKRRIGVRQPSKLKPGNTPDSAISVKSSEDITAYLTNFKCDCGQRPYRAEAPPAQERFTYDGRWLASVRIKCSSCSRSSDLYFGEHAAAMQSVQLATD